MRPDAATGPEPGRDRGIVFQQYALFPWRTAAQNVEFGLDIAGLVAGASKGEGKGNDFLSNIRECDAIIHVVRCFDNDDIVHSMGKVLL